MNYKVHLCGTAEDNAQDGFKMGFDITVENGGSVKEIGAAMQSTIDILSHRIRSVKSVDPDKVND